MKCFCDKFVSQNSNEIPEHLQCPGRSDSSSGISESLATVISQHEMVSDILLDVWD